MISLAEQEEMQGPPVDRLVRIEEEPEVQEDGESVIEEANVLESHSRRLNSNHGEGISDYARSMVTAEPMSVSTSTVAAGKRIKTIVYRRRSLSLD